MHGRITLKLEDVTKMPLELQNYSAEGIFNVGCKSCS